MKRVVKSLMVIAFICSIVAIELKPMSVSAKISGDYSYEVIGENEVEITNYNGSDTVLIIPSELDGKMVKRIGYGAFAECKSLVKVVIPDTVISLGNYAFSQCVKLEEIEIPDSVVSLGQHAFNGCNSLESVRIPKNVKDIGYGTFFDCLNLTSVEMPEGVQSIGGMVFSGCKSLESIQLPSSLTSIGGNAFSDCIRLESIDIPFGVSTIGASSFAGCIALKDIQLPESVVGIGQSAFQDCVSLERIDLPQSIEAIGYSAFSGCSSLLKIEIPTKLTSIGNAVFSGCNSLTEITIPNSITSIGENAFSGCVKLKAIDIPDSVLEIGASAFSNCSELERVTLPKRLKVIETSLFRYCYKLDSIMIPNSVVEMKATVFADCMNLKSVILPSSISNDESGNPKMGSRIFSNCPNVLVSVANNSPAHIYVRKNDVPFQLIAEGINLDVANLSLKVGEARRYQAIFSPYTLAENNKLTWESSNPSVASIDTNGVVSAIAVGESEITVKSTNGFTSKSKVTVNNTEIQITSLSLNKTKVTMKKGSTEGLFATITPQNTTNNKTLQWSSDNSEVVTVSSTGQLTAKGPGNATIRVESENGVFVECAVTVISEIKSVTLNLTAINLDVNTTQSLRATINPSDTTDDKTLIWKSSNDRFVSVDQTGNITTHEKGTATITVTTSNGKKAECKVSVNEVSNIPIQSVSLNKTELQLKKNQGEQLLAVINPSNTTDDPTITWKSSDESVASVSASGWVSAKTAGTTTITATTSNGKVASCTLTVFDTSMDELEALIILAEAKDEVAYTRPSYMVMKEEIRQAKLIVGDITSSQEIVDQKVITLQQAMDSLVFVAKSEDIDALTLFIVECKKVELNYPSEIYSDMKAALVVADNILAKDARDISAKEVSDTMIALFAQKENLDIWDLQQELNATIISAQAILDGDVSNIQPQKLQALKDARKDAQRVLDDNVRDPKVIIAATNNLNEAMQDLSEVVDNSILVDLVAGMELIEKGNYTDVSWQTFQVKLSFANEVIANSKASATEVERAYVELLNAAMKLEIKVNKESLAFQIETANKILNNRERYVASSIKNLDTVLAQSKLVYDNPNVTQDEVRTATNQLVVVTLKARLKPN